MLTVYINRLNDPGKTGDYEYTVTVNQNVIHRGFIGGHIRSKGWAALLKMVAKDGQRSPWTPGAR